MTVWRWHLYFDTGTNQHTFMLYYTQLIFIKPGKEDTFNRFEDQVLPLLPKHHGALLYRVRPAATSVLTTQIGIPYELHLVSFPSRTEFETYRDDPERQHFLQLKDQSIEKALLIEGQLL